MLDQECVQLCHDLSLPIFNFKSFQSLDNSRQPPETSQNREVVAEDDAKVGAVLFGQFFLKPGAPQAQPQTLEEAEISWEPVVDRQVHLAGIAGNAEGLSPGAACRFRPSSAPPRSPPSSPKKENMRDATRSAAMVQPFNSR